MIPKESSHLGMEIKVWSKVLVRASLETLFS
jgi:hypothetical protein